MAIGVIIITIITGAITTITGVIIIITITGGGITAPSAYSVLPHGPGKKRVMSL